MNKKNIMLILAGIIIQALEFTISISTIRIDIFSDIIAYALILIGVSGLTNRNKLFKKSRGKAIGGLLAAIMIQAINCIYFGDSATTMNTLTRGITTIFAIYFPYYFTEALILEAKLQDKAALTRNFRLTWSILGLLIFIYFIAFMSNITIVSIVAEIFVMICVIYYASTVLTICDQLYMEGLPERMQQ